MQHPIHPSAGCFFGNVEKASIGRSEINRRPGSAVKGPRRFPEKQDRYRWRPRATVNSRGAATGTPSLRRNNPFGVRGQSKKGSVRSSRETDFLREKPLHQLRECAELKIGPIAILETIRNKGERNAVVDGRLLVPWSVTNHDWAGEAGPLNHSSEVF